MTSESAIEYEPAQLVAEPLVVEDELADPGWQLVALPLALSTTGVAAAPFRRRRSDSPDGMGGRTQLVGGDVGHHARLPRGEGGVPGSSRKVARGRVRMASCGARVG